MASTSENSQISPQIRPMTAADLTQVLEIAASLPELPHWPESAYLTALDPSATPRRIALVAFAEPDCIDGFVVASLLPPQAALESIGVPAGSQRQSFGRMLFNELAKELRKAGIVEVALEVRASNHAALAFYRSQGFGQTGLRRAYYIDPVEDAVMMKLDLS